jgi:Major Facilitator Superfamily
MAGLTGLVAALGVAQVISWGTLYYSISVLGPAIRAELGVSEVLLFGAFTGGLLVSGALAPMAGRFIDAKGGRVVMSAGSLVAALSMVVLAAAPNREFFIAGWLLAGVAMSMTLYDPAFATLSQHAGERYRRMVTVLTLLGGFASTVFWPISHVLVEAWGWRASFAVYAALHLLICLPVHAALIPRFAQGLRHGARSEAGARSPGFADPRLKWLNASFSIASFSVGLVAVHMVGLLTTVGLTAAQAVAAAMLLGPMQVAGRIGEMAFLTRVRSTVVGTMSFGLIAISILALAVAADRTWLAIAFVAVFGAGNGIFTIVRGAAPAELFGGQGLGELLGHLSRTSLFARALAPGAYSLVLTLGLTQSLAMGLLGIVTACGLACFFLASRPSHSP